MLDEAIKLEKADLEERMKDITLYLSGQVEEGTIQTIEAKVSSVQEQLAKASNKAEQRAAEAAKRAELATAGVNPRDKLTKQNLEKWLAEGKSFSQIAREEVGLRQEEVSAAAKKYDLKPAKKCKEQPPQIQVLKEE
jgi:multidrug resistance efflux pump